MHRPLPTHQPLECKGAPHHPVTGAINEGTSIPGVLRLNPRSEGGHPSGSRGPGAAREVFRSTMRATLFKLSKHMWKSRLPSSKSERKKHFYLSPDSYCAGHPEYATARPLLIKLSLQFFHRLNLVFCNIGYFMESCFWLQAMSSLLHADWYASAVAAEVCSRTNAASSRAVAGSSLALASAALLQPAGSLGHTISCSMESSWWRCAYCRSNQQASSNWLCNNAASSSCSMLPVATA